MPTEKQFTEELQARLAADPRRGTPEQVEQARRNAMQRNVDCRLDCPICHGKSWVRDGGGKLIRCPNVSGRARFPGDRYGLTDAERGLAWDKVYRMKEVETALAAVRQVMERGAGWVYLWGPPGLAKTLILKIAVARSLEECQEAAYTRMAQILDNMRMAYDASNPSSENQSRLDWWADLPLLAIDEFDRLRATEFAAERRFLLMDRRYESALRCGAAKSRPSSGYLQSYQAALNFGRRGAITLMAGNEDPALLDSYLYDRISDGRFHVVHLTGESLRPVMGWE
jgi:hypothetical protein